MNYPDESSHFEEGNGRPLLGGISDLIVPREYHDLGDSLLNFKEEELEFHLRKFDAFLASANSAEREAIGQILFRISSKATPANKRLRLIKAANSVRNGGCCVLE